MVMVRATAIRGFCALIAASAAIDFASAQTAPFNYVKKATREESRAATLAQYLPDLEWGSWWVIGPFDDADFKKHNIVYPPEMRIDLDAAYEGKNGVTARWERLEQTDWSKVNLARYGRNALNTYAAGYVYREVVSPRDATIDAEMGSDDGLKFWLNGRLLVDADVPRGLNPQDHLVKLPLRAGRNTILAKVTQGVGDWEFQMQPRLDPFIAAQLEYHLNLDFPLSEESKYYKLLTVLEPRDVVLEVGGLTTLPDGRPVVTTRRGEVWIIENAYDDPPFNAKYQLFASGLHEPLGASFRDGGLYVVQRGELTKLIDDNGDDRADVFETVSDQWGVSGNYHEFAFGPKFDGAGRIWVSLNVGFCGSLGKSVVPWRGWAVVVDPETGALEPICGGLRSPNGLGANADGEMFYTDNQGDWVGTNKLSHLVKGSWHGHPSSDRWYEQAGLTPPQGESDFKAPAIWFPYDKMGRSASDILLDDTAGKFGPFENQLFVGDQYSAIVMRVFLEKVRGEYQGACFPFRTGFDCGVNRMCFGPDGSMFVGMTNRGWWSIGNRPWGLQRLVYTGVLPFEVKEMMGARNGFELTFTKPVDAVAAGDSRSYAMSSYTYHRWEKYGSPEIDTRDLRIARAVVSEDRLSVRVVVEGLREGYVHELHLDGVRSADGEELLHPEAYYTLNAIPDAP